MNPGGVFCHLVSVALWHFGLPKPAPYNNMLKCLSFAIKNTKCPIALFLKSHVLKKKFLCQGKRQEKKWVIFNYESHAKASQAWIHEMFGQDKPLQLG